MKEGTRRKNRDPAVSHCRERLGINQTTDTAGVSPPSPGEKSPPASLSQCLLSLLGPCRMLLVLDGRGCPFRSRRSRLGRRAHTGLRLRNGRPRCHILPRWLVHFG